MRLGRRARAAAFLGAAVICALLAAAVAGRYRSAADTQYGALRPVVVAAADLPAGELIDPAAAKSLEVRRVPAAFVPPGAIRSPQEALGREPGALISAGSYLVGSQLALPLPDAPSAPGAGPGRSPVQVAVAGAEALTLGGQAPEGMRVDVVVAQRSGLGTSARTFVAASGARLLALRRPQGAGQGWTATLAVSRSQALELIEAEAASREIRLLPGA